MNAVNTDNSYSMTPEAYAKDHGIRITFGRFSTCASNLTPYSRVLFIKFLRAKGYEIAENSMTHSITYWMGKRSI